MMLQTVLMTRCSLLRSTHMLMLDQPRRRWLPFYQVVFTRHDFGQNLMLTASIMEKDQQVVVNAIHEAWLGVQGHLVSLEYATHLLSKLLPDDSMSTKCAFIDQPLTKIHIQRQSAQEGRRTGFYTLPRLLSVCVALPDDRSHTVS